MGQSQETYRSQQEEDEITTEEVRSVGNKALDAAVKNTDDFLDFVDELLKEDEYSEENAQREVQQFTQKGGE